MDLKTEKEAIAEEIGAVIEKISQERKKLNELRARYSKQSVSDYDLTRSDGSPVKLSELFDGREEMIWVHNMGRRCPYCTLWADGLNGVWRHLANRAAFVVGSPDSPEVQTEFKLSRGWEFPMVSVKGSSINADLGFYGEYDGEATDYPGFSTLKMNQDGSIERVNAAFFGPGDDFCAVWHMIDLLEKGANGWEPKYSYPSS